MAAPLDVTTGELDRFGRDLAGAGQSFASACGRIAGSRIARGRVTKIDDRRRRIEVDGIVAALRKLADWASRSIRA